jgi:hypothetical protein
MEFYLDDCAYSKHLVRLLQQAGTTLAPLTVTRTPHSENPLTSGLPLANELHSLNHWR